jgi:hypothetical protein
LKALISFEVLSQLSFRLDKRGMAVVFHLITKTNPTWVVVLPKYRSKTRITGDRSEWPHWRVDPFEDEIHSSQSLILSIDRVASPSVCGFEVQARSLAKEDRSRGYIVDEQCSP